MDILNDDCQLSIIKYLTITDQLALLEATNEEPTSRLHWNVRYFWQHQLKFTLVADDFLLFEDNPELLEEFLSSISPTVRRLELQYVTLKNLKCLETHSYPAMKSLKYTMDDEDAERNGNQFINLIAKLFPELRSLKAYGEFDCINLTNMMNLRKLNLSGCWSSNFNAMEISKLQLLEKLNVPYNFLNEEFCIALMQMPHFQKLTYHFNGDHSEYLSGMRLKDVQQITFNDSIWAFSFSTLQGMSNLRHCTILEDDGFTGADLLELVSCYSKLERLDLIDFSIWRSESELWQTVANCPSLKILNITTMPLYADFFDTNRRAMNEVLDRRSIPLTLHCHETGEYEDLIRLNFKHPNLKVSFDPLIIKYIYSNSVQVYFSPLTTNEAK